MHGLLSRAPQQIDPHHLSHKMRDMDTSQELRHRSMDDGPPTTTTDTATTTADPETKERREQKLAMAKGGLRSLSVAAAVPILLTLANIYMFGSSDAYKATAREPNWVPPLWALHSTCLASALLMGLSGWLFWAQGGLRRSPNAVGIYLAQLLLSLAWDPLVFRLGANRAGLAVAGAVFWLVWWCSKMFGEVSGIAGDLVKPCLAWAGFLGFVNLKFILSSASQASA